MARRAVIEFVRIVLRLRTCAECGVHKKRSKFATMRGGPRDRQPTRICKACIIDVLQGFKAEAEGLINETEHVAL